MKKDYYYFLRLRSKARKLCMKLNFIKKKKPMCRVASVSFVLITTCLENFIGPLIRQQAKGNPY